MKTTIILLMISVLLSCNGVGYYSYGDFSEHYEKLLKVISEDQSENSLQNSMCLQRNSALIAIKEWQNQKKKHEDLGKLSSWRSQQSKLLLTARAELERLESNFLRGGPICLIP